MRFSSHPAAHPARCRISKLAAVTLIAVGVLLPLKAAFATGIAPAPGHPASGGPAAVAATIDFGASADGEPWDMSQVTSFEHDSGKQLSILNWYEAWQDTLTYGGPGLDLLNSVSSTGAVPMISWAPDDYTQGVTQPNYTLATLAAGTYDSYVRSWAQQLASYGKPVLLRWAWEMNGNWDSWGQGVNGNTPQQYVAAWRHLHDIFSQAGAKNVQWVWSPNVLGGPVTELESLYPGDAYVDWLALDGYNRPMWGWQTFTQVFGPTYTRLVAMSHKPVMIAETSSGEADANSPAGTSKAGWITSALTQEIPQAFPQVRALVWYNVDKAGLETGGYDWRIESSSAAQSAFAQAVSGALYTSTYSYPSQSTATPTPSPSPSPTKSPTPSPTASPTASPSPAATKSATPSPTPVPSPNLLQNGSFENAGGSGQGLFSPWWLEVKSGAVASLNPDASAKTDGAQSARIAVTQSSAYWYVQLYQHIAALAVGTPYTISFSAKAAKATPLTVDVQQSPSPYTVYSEQRVSLSTAWQRFTLTYTPSAGTDPDTLLLFNLGTNVTTYWLDNVTLTGGGSLPAVTRTASPTASPAATKTSTSAPTASPSPSPTPSPSSSPSSSGGSVCTAPTFSVYPAAVATQGDDVTISMATSGCSSPIYRIYAYSPDGNPHMLRDYNGASSFTWQTTTWSAGAYRIEVDVRDVSAQVDQQASSSAGYSLVAP
jgi:hypothetical protein